ncbi:unnamed protein product [Malus baccata var. baccata]
MFNKGFAIEGDDLIQLWMAQGLLHPSSENSDLEIEDIGIEYFHILLQNSLLQDLTKDEFGVVAKCKMHALVHDFAELVSKSESATSGSNEMVSTLKIRHASHIPTSVLESIPKKTLRGLRSLFSNNEVPRNMLPRFRGLHVLNLYNANIKELPISIGKLKQLRYLNVFGTEIKAIPKSIGKLHNLQTLRMEYCRHLKVFPKEMGNLVNLIHVYFGPVRKKKRANFGWYRESLAGVGQLINLRTMPYFVVSPDESNRSIEELAGLNHLKGELAIYDLEHVRDREEAKKSNLVGKRKIHKLSLVWGEEMRPCNNSEDDVLQGLQPHPNLEILEICNFMGAQFPSWKPYNNLKKIRLLQCDVCEEAPMLGHLPSLMHLEFNTMHNLKRLRVEFYGYNGVDDAIKTKALFPALKTFRICAVLNMIEWIEPPVRKEEQITVFPCLEELELVECLQMRNFPNQFSSLHKLKMSICHELSDLTSLVEKCTSLQNLEISSCDKLRSLSLFGLTSIRKLLFSSCGGGLTSTNLHRGSELYTRVSLEEWSIKCPSLEKLEISRCVRLKINSCGELRSMDLQSLPECYIPLKYSAYEVDISLIEELTIYNCPKLICISNHSLMTLRKLILIASCESEFCIYTSLVRLEIRNCENLISLADADVTSLQSLSMLRIRNCKKLQYLSRGLHTLTRLERLGIGELWEELDSFPVSKIPSSKILGFFGWPKLKSLPQVIHHSTSPVKYLTIGNCDGLETLPEWLAMQCLINLEHLIILGCPILKERCARGTGTEWPKISRIPGLNHLIPQNKMPDKKFTKM